MFSVSVDTASESELSIGSDTQASTSYYSVKRCSAKRFETPFAPPPTCINKSCPFGIYAVDSGVACLRKRRCGIAT